MMTFILQFKARSAARAMRAFVLLSAVVAATVVRAQQPNNGCALIVSGPPKSALFDQVGICVIKEFIVCELGLEYVGTTWSYICSFGYQH